MYFLVDIGTYSQIQLITWILQVLTRRYKYFLRETGTCSEIQVLTWRYKYLLGDTGSYLEIHVLILR